MVSKRLEVIEKLIVKLKRYEKIILPQYPEYYHLQVWKFSLN